MPGEHERFQKMARLFGQAIASHGFSRATISEKRASTGWYCKITKWGTRNPGIFLWYDRWLDTEERHFWFGFVGSPAQISTLRSALPDNRIPALYQNDAFQGPYQGPTLKVVNDHKGFVHEQYRDDSHYLGFYDIGLSAINDAARAAEVAGLIAGIVKYVDPIDEDQADIDTIKKLKNLSLTKKKQLIMARRGQGLFRKALDQIWEGKCAVTGVSARQALRASHIKPWKQASNKQRLDGHNGLLLVATIDALFDKGLISFADDGCMHLSPMISNNDKKILRLTAATLRSRPSRQQAQYLREHRRQHGFETD